MTSRPFLPLAWLASVFFGSCEAPPPLTSREPLAEIAILGPDNRVSLAPSGKEADAIHGDYLLRNERIVAVVARPVPGRHANVRTRDVGGCLIDLTTRDAPNDLLTVFCPGGVAPACEATLLEPASDEAMVRGRRVAVGCEVPAGPDRPGVLWRYELGAEDAWITVTTELRNTGREPVPGGVVDRLRAEGRSFDRTTGGIQSPFQVYDRWFGQAYAVVGEGVEAEVRSSGDDSWLEWSSGGAAAAPLAPEESRSITRRVVPARDTISLQGVLATIRGELLTSVALDVSDSRGPVPRIDVSLLRDGLPWGEGRTGLDGRLPMMLPMGSYRAHVGFPAGEPHALDLEVLHDDLGRSREARLYLPATPRLTGRIRDSAGRPIPVKIVIVGIEGTPTPDFGPPEGERAVRNLIYTPDGRFETALPPGTYQVHALHGPEYDVASRRIEIREGGRDGRIDLTLARSVDTRGWVAADLHGHSSASGDNATSQAGRVLNLAAEGIEFAPCTEHNRIDSYEPHIAALGLRPFLKSVPGIELTATPFGVNHHNAFPLRMKPGEQGNGAPASDRDPVAQIRRLAEWDSGSDKLVQQNHPDFGWLFFDRDGDGEPDGGHEGILAFQDVIETWGIDILRTGATFIVERELDESGPPVRVRENVRVFNWLQLLNQGVRLPGVANTDAHHNFHGSGGLRNFIRSSTDDPSRIDPMEMVHALEAGHSVMTNGPFVTVDLIPLVDGVREAAAAPRAIPGSEVTAPSGRVRLRIRVQTPNWFDIDRVSVLLNGRPAPDLSFTRYNNPSRFSDGPIKFDQALDFDLLGDTHVIVVAAHKKELPQELVGPKWGVNPPVAISNPIWVDVDGGGFKANGDTLGHPLPVRQGREAETSPEGG